MKAVFVDSKEGQPCPQGCEKALPRLMLAIEKLNEAFSTGKVEVLTLRGTSRSSLEDIHPLVTYQATKAHWNNSWDTITEAKFNVSHFVGTYTTIERNEPFLIEIQPRWGAEILSYLLQYTSGIYLPLDASSGMDLRRHGAEWLLVLLWKSAFSQALRRSHTPKEYRSTRTNDRYFRGRLDVPRQIRENLTNQSRFCCTYSPLTVDTTINRTFRHVFRLLQRKGQFASLVNDLTEYDARLASFGVKSDGVKLAEIDAVRFTKMSAAYRPFLQASKGLLRSLSSEGGKTDNEGAAYFVDIAEIWENYIEAVLTEHLPEFRVINPNLSGGDWLLAGHKREIRPDLLIEYQGQIVAVLDAKFKAYRQIGQFERGGVSRSDLFQMTTYLYHYGVRGRPIIGLFVSPIAADSDCATEVMASDETHRLGVINFALPPCDDTDSAKGTTDALFDIEVVKAKEKAFAEHLRAQLRLLMGDAERKS